MMRAVEFPCRVSFLKIMTLQWKHILSSKDDTNDLGTYMIRTMSPLGNGANAIDQNQRRSSALSSQRPEISNDIAHFVARQDSAHGGHHRNSWRSRDNVCFSKRRSMTFEIEEMYGRGIFQFDGGGDRCAVLEGER